ncbi:DUF397 domain-containing protein [Streptomyces ochraceiscleroticus]|uniref:DUF397 domain-containing protein n=1 Tax=Streptomyces ochraceiscleroticus TaxID=47761 RepID=A0ABW1MDS0_9ACTN|nr:DUF397 domain-containing protein [Streptomyces ochraceiscleroticus]
MSTSLTLAEARWRKSSYSGDTGGDCVEIAEVSALIAIRDSKNPDGPVLTVAHGTFAEFIGYVGRQND